MKFTTEQVDIISMISVVVKKIPVCYAEDLAEWWIVNNESIAVDFGMREIHLINWSYSDDITYLQILGIAQMYDLGTEDYMRD